MNDDIARTLQETTTTLSGDEVLARAKSFFASRPSLYATFLDKEGPGFCVVPRAGRRGDRHRRDAARRRAARA